LEVLGVRSRGFGAYVGAAPRLRNILSLMRNSFSFCNTKLPLPQALFFIDAARYGAVEISRVDNIFI
jgi:hypothetical protein